MSNNSSSRKYLGSPTFPLKNVAILTGATTVLDFSKRATASEKYAPFNTFTITNDSTENISVAVNQNENNTIFIPAGVIKSFDKKSYPAVYSFAVTNLGSGTISADEITIEVQKEVIDGETIISSVANKILGVGRGFV